MTLQAQMMHHTSKLNEDSAQYGCNLEKCMLSTKDGNSHSNFVIMQLTVFIIDSYFCLLNYPLRGELQNKTIVFLEFHEDVLFFKSRSNPVPLPQKEELCGTELLSCRGRKGHRGFTFSLGRVLEGCGWTMAVVGGKWASRLIAWSVAG